MSTTAPENPLTPRGRSISVLLFVLIISLPFGSLFAQKKSIKQLVHDLWTTGSGLPQNSASDIIQTRDGYLWFATQEGLARFDGVKFTVFDRANTDALPNSWILRLCEDSSGAMWIRAQGFAPGITRYQKGVFTQFTTANGLPNNTVTARAVDHGGGIWFATLGGLSHFKAGTFTNYTVKDGLPSDTVNSLGVDSKENVWFSTPRGMARWSGGTIEKLTGTPAFPDTTFFRVSDFSIFYEDNGGTLWMRTKRGILSFSQGTTRLYTTNEGLPSLIVNDILQSKDGNLWFATEKGMARFQNGRFTAIKASLDPDENSIFSIREDAEGSLWLVTGKGIKRYDNGTFESYLQKDGLSDNAVQTMLIDHEGSIWLGTFGGGVDRFRDAKFVTYSSRSGLSFDNVQPVLEDSKGALWIGSNSAGLDRLEDGIVTTFSTKNGLPANDVRDMMEDNEGNVWIATARGVVSFKNGAFTARSKVSATGSNLKGNAMVLRKSGEFLVASDNEVYAVHGSALTHFFTVDSAHTPSAANFIQDIWEDSKGTLWIATNRFLYWHKDGKVIQVSNDQGLSSTWIQSFYEDKEGTIWLGASSYGFVRFKNGTFAIITPKQGLFDFNGYVMFEDSQGYLWSSCNKGIFRVSKSELNDVADGKAQSLHCTSYNESDGMESRECNGGYTPSGAVLRDGRLAFASVKGVVIVNPMDIKVNPIPPPVVIEQLIADGVQSNVSVTSALPAGTNRLEIHYAGLSFIGGDKVRFKYKLEGSDPDWIDAGSRREAYYTNVSPGEYTFRVIAANSDGVWNEHPATLGFELKPYFYQTKWFLTLAIVLFLTTGPSIYYWRVHSLKQREASLEAQVNKRTEELQKTLTNLKEAQHQLVLSEKMASLGQLTAGIAHEIKNPLNFITNFAVLSKELTHELRGELSQEKSRVDPERATEITEILDNLEQNVKKIDEHGKRADSIVRGMLLHSRGKAGERQDTDLNALLSEYTNLAYHGMRAQDSSFNVKIETEFDPSIGKVSIVPQDLSRAFLNIVNNACYAANDKRRSAKNGFSPTVRVSARNLGKRVEIRIRDNGNGIPKEVRDKIFNPFFTTKPAGVGTGLGLSITYDIIRDEHNGDIEVNTEPGEFTEFVIVLPNELNRGAAA